MNTRTAFNAPYPELNAVLQEFISRVHRILCDDLVGVYLQGSFAVGDFDEHSDCDFVIVVNQDLSDAQLRELQLMHDHIFGLGVEWAKHLEGSYFPKAILRDYTSSGSVLWYLDNGHSQLERSRHCNSIVTRWILREMGVVLSGPEPSTLIDSIPVEVLRRTILASIGNSGRQILENPELYNNRFYQSFIVLHNCRKLHDLHTGQIGSKRTGAEWAKNNLDRSWSDLIDRAWTGRPNPALSIQQPANKADFESTLQFVRAVMEAARKYALTEGLLREE